MKKKMSLMLIMAVSMMLGLSGCGESTIPGLSEEDMQTVGEYAAITLMKYDASSRSRLVSLSLLEKEEEQEQIQIPEQTQDEPEGMRPTADTPTENHAETQNSYAIEEVLDLPEGIVLSYTEEEFCSQYPYNGSDNYFVVTPTEGSRLLLLKFTMSNTSQEEQTVDILSAGCSYTITLNEADRARALPTMLLDDMSTFAETIPAGSSRDVVLVFETQKTVEEISSAVLTLKNEAKTHTIQLF